MIKPLSELAAAAKSQCQCIDFDQVPQFLQSHPKLLFIDVREPDEHQLCAVKGAVNIPRGIIEMKLPNLSSDPEQSILLHCATGGRAAFTALSLKQMGYNNLTVVNGSAEQLSSVCC